MPERRTVEVWAGWGSFDPPLLMGLIHATPARGKEVLAFEYDATWLSSGQAQSLDPRLQLFGGDQYPAADHPNFGVFLDSSPDRWGRVLLDRREAYLARATKRAAKKLLEIDYLLGVFDGHRMGGLRYRLPGGPFLDDNADLASPPWTSLRELEHASARIQAEGAEDQPDYGVWLHMLLAPGRSLGGARPKASVLDPDGALWIAKFPSTDDVDDIGAWESIVHALATCAGITTPTTKRLKLTSKHHTFLAQRFDRTSTGSRRHFASAMTLLDRRDGEEGASYLDLAAVIMQQGAHPDRDLEELWRRIAFFVCVSNIDDHLRNHGFLLEPAGWTLAPAYDMNPVAHAGGLTLNISETDNAQDLELVREVAKHFRVKPKRASEIIDQIRTAVRRWPEEAAAAHISKAQRERMAPAFAAAM